LDAAEEAGGKLIIKIKNTFSFYMIKALIDLNKSLDKIRYYYYHNPTIQG